MGTLVVLADDLDNAQGTITAADGTHYIGVDGIWREIDVTDEHWAEYQEATRRFWEVARVCPPPGQALTGSYQGYPGRIRYWKDFRAWADQRGIRYTSDGGGFYPHRRDVREFDDWLRENGRIPVEHNWTSHGGKPVAKDQHGQEENRAGEHAA